MYQKRLCLVIPSLQAGGMERVMTELAWHFTTKRDLEVHLVLYGITREIFYSIPGNIIIHKPTFLFKNRFRFYYTIKTTKESGGPKRQVCITIPKIIAEDMEDGKYTIIISKGDLNESRKT